MIQPMENNVIIKMPDKKNIKVDDNKHVDFKKIIKSTQNGNVKGNDVSSTKINNNQLPIDKKKLITDFINLIVNLLPDSLKNEINVNKIDTSLLIDENIVKQINNCLNNIQYTRQVDIGEISKIISQLLKEKFGLNIDTKTIFNMIKDKDFKDFIKLPSIDMIDNKIKEYQDNRNKELDLNVVHEYNNNKSKINEVQDSNQMDNLKIAKDVIKNVNQNNNNSNQEMNKKDDEKKLFYDIKVDKKNSEIKNLNENKGTQENNKTLDLKTDNVIIFQGNQENVEFDTSPNVFDVKKPLRENDIINQIVKNINLTKNDTTSTIKIQLKPDFLGRIEINIKSTDGNLTANILTDNEKVKHQIEANLSLLSNQLESKGIKIESFNVSVDKNMQFTSQYNEQGSHGERYQEQNNNKFRFNYDDDYESTEFGTKTYALMNNLTDDHVDVII
ncbi:flagellar hook-length control protein FliK [Thermoanaerobacterium sp. RBIITD]|uniref:flagellar hook-length control protein FliK n=1 Tax=Thermoanaerobacterium sp. RBIITD TaxID=1550240 RepID=UPI000BB944B7|nr:flagellar hook-length control protein FliK [Thermoanaerobacterium sp. RBIITD]SNX55517.1 flagellar hook-length control protein FliK [Thermoanaerobacterium sp. RBIITD]